MVRTGPCVKLKRLAGRAPGAKHDPPTAGSGAVGWKAQLLASPVLGGMGFVASRCILFDGLGVSPSRAPAGTWACA